MIEQRDKPRLLITLGDVAGIGPEIVAKAWRDLLPLCRPVVVGDPEWVARGLTLAGISAQAKLSPEQIALLPPPASHQVSFGKEIRPILEASCTKCHDVFR